ncbi:MAG: hypothetical protein ABIC40_02665, partial [bacterium]
ASVLPNTDLALSRAESMVVANFGDPDSQIYSPTGSEYRVTLTTEIPTFFMRLLGHDNMVISATAKAIAERPLGGLNGGGFPFAIINPNLNNDPSDDFTIWNYGKPYIVGYGEDNVMIEDWANGSAAPPSSPGKGGKGGGKNNSMGWRGILGLNDDGTYGHSGASDLKNIMANGWNGIMLIGDEVPCKFGNMAGPTRDGREALLGENPIDWDDFDIERNSKSSRVVLVPIVHLINATRGDTFTVADFYNGASWVHNTVVVDGFAPFFILAEGEYEQYLNVKGNTHDWLLGYFIPGVDTSHFMHPGGGAPDYGLYSPPRLID